MWKTRLNFVCLMIAHLPTAFNCNFDRMGHKMHLKKTDSRPRGFLSVFLYGKIVKIR